MVPWRLSTLTWEEVEDAVSSNAVAVLPVGATEQHGPALPVAVDSVLVEHMAIGAAERCHHADQRVVVAPTLPYGCSHYHMNFPGTMSLPTAVFIEAVGALAESVLKHGFTRLLVLNGHGGNHAPLAVVVRNVHERTGATIGAASYWNLASERIGALRESPIGGISHACEMETSLMYVAAPGSVREDRRVRFIPEWEQRWHAQDLLEDEAVMVMEDTRALTATGVCGDATLASEGKGRLMREAIVEELALFLQDFATIEYHNPRRDV
jgi:creatinine amidohydrolase